MFGFSIFRRLEGNGESHGLGNGLVRAWLAFAMILHSWTALAAEERPTNLPERFTEVTPRIATGAEIHDAAVFKTLKEEGFQVVVSVDGLRPPVEKATAAGLRYVHLPVGYDAITVETQAALRTLLQETDGKVFIHCHHGKHRGPAAAALAGLVSGDIKQKSTALQVLEQCETSKDYAGLWRAVESFTMPPAEAASAPLVAVAKVEPLVESMTTIDRLFEELSHKHKEALSQKQQYEKATLLWEQFGESARHTKDSEMAKALQASAKAANALRQAIHEGTNTATLLTAMRRDCRACHRKFRD